MRFKFFNNSWIIHYFSRSVYDYKAISTACCRTDLFTPNLYTVFCTCQNKVACTCNYKISNMYSSHNQSPVLTTPAVLVQLFSNLTIYFTENQYTHAGTVNNNILFRKYILYVPFFFFFSPNVSYPTVLIPACTVNKTLPVGEAFLGNVLKNEKAESLQHVIDHIARQFRSSTPHRSQGTVCKCVWIRQKRRPCRRPIRDIKPLSRVASLSAVITASPRHCATPQTRYKQRVGIIGRISETSVHFSKN